MRVLLLADTHITDGVGRSLPGEVLAVASEADLVLHAGDVTGVELLRELSGRAPVHAVLGNNDRKLVGDLPQRLVLDLDGVRVAMVHDAGATSGRAERLRRWFPEADLAVFGHSHLPEDLTGDDGLRIFNPGSPTQRRRAPTRTYGTLEIGDGEVRDLRHHHLEPPT